MKLTNKFIKVNINKINKILCKNWLLIGIVTFLFVFSLFIFNSNKQKQTEKTKNESNNNESNNENNDSENIKEGFKAFDDCRIAGYPFKFCINIPFNSEGLYETWVQYNENQKYL